VYHNFDFTNYFFFGWLGVDLFFVLSGFLITDILLRTLDQPHFLRNFYTRRILRIFPLYYLALFLILIVLPFFKSLQLDLTYYEDHQIWLWTYLQNWLYTFKHPYGSKILLHFWSLAVEEQFYLLWPVTILLIRKPKILLAISIGLLIAVGATRFVLWNLHLKDLAYANLFLFTRIDGICVGCMLALLIRIDFTFLRRKMALILAILAVFNFLFYFFNKKYSPGSPFLAFVGYTTFAILFGLLVYEGVAGKIKVIDKIFNNKVMKFFGRISYGLYVYHWPVYVLLFPVLKNFFTNQIVLSNLFANIVSALGVITLSVIISVISYRYFESYFLRLKSKFT
jgi:peptidoglycan/LPS O-acetylase OafA/YrhL